MSNGRSFTRNRKGSPNKSKRRQRQSQQAAVRAMTAIRAAQSSSNDTVAASVEAALLASGLQVDPNLMETALEGQ